MKISGSFITMLIIWLLAFTHFLGGPYLLFKVIFWIMLLPFFFSAFFVIVMFLKTRKILRNNVKATHSHRDKQETIHIEAEIKE